MAAVAGRVFTQRRSERDTRALPWLKHDQARAHPRPLYSLSLRGLMLASMPVKEEKIAVRGD
jgi:hypothetical protein